VETRATRTGRSRVAQVKKKTVGGRKAVIHGLGHGTREAGANLNQLQTTHKAVVGAKCEEKREGKNKEFRDAVT